MPNSAGNKRAAGCWTCRLRRKRCDDQRPQCENCQSLRITCHNGAKPLWMDGGSQQQQMSRAIKMEIRRGAELRRQKPSTTDKDAPDASFSGVNILHDLVRSERQPGGVSFPNADHMSLDGTRDMAKHTAPARSAMLPYEHQRRGCPHENVQSAPLELDLVTKYLDYVFPAFFPYYRPVLFETGRSWLLLLIGQSDIVYHAAVSLAGYFFTLALHDAEGADEHADCKQTHWQEVQEQTGKCFESIRAEMTAVAQVPAPTSTTTLAKVHLMQSLIHIFFYESALGRSAPWTAHLPPAFALFEEVMGSVRRTPESQNQAKLSKVLLNIGEPLWTKPGHDVHTWTPDQAGFRFCAGLLIFIDVIASTATQQRPRLQDYHEVVLDQQDDGNFGVFEAEVRLSGVVGCRNWIIQIIAEISALDAWKKEQIQAGGLSPVGVSERASHLSARLKNGIRDLQAGSRVGPSIVQEERGPFSARSTAAASHAPSLIWAQAAELYLLVVTTGWQPLNADIRANVTQIMTLLQTVAPHQLRAHAWPLCVAGCLALDVEETTFTALLSIKDKAYTAGVLDDARQILKRVWGSRAQQAVNSWDLAKCFGILGSPVLLA